MKMAPIIFKIFTIEYDRPIPKASYPTLSQKIMSSVHVNGMRFQAWTRLVQIVVKIQFKWLECRQMITITYMLYR